MKQASFSGGFYYLGNKLLSLSFSCFYYLRTTVHLFGILLFPNSSGRSAGHVNVPEEETPVTQLVVPYAESQVEKFTLILFSLEQY
jgi:hypothetical protein